MNIIQQLRALIPNEVFDYQILMYALRSYKKPRDKVTSLLKNGDLIQVKRGLYVFGEAHRKGLLSLEVVSGMLVQPSYISREYALQKYGLLTERVETITCMTIGNKKQFETPIGRFDYAFIGKRKFGVGVISKENAGEGGVLYATKEKALADWLASVPLIKDLQMLRHFLFEESRIDEKSLFPLDRGLLCEIISIYKNPNVTFLSNL
jgi:hypothetical protein